MKPFKPREQKGPEAKIRDEVERLLRAEGWHVIRTHGNAFQSGLPDLFVCHRRYGTRWIEVKNPLQFSFTRAQMENFPLMAANGAGIWILVAATPEEYAKLFKPMNWWQYLSIYK